MAEIAHLIAYGLGCIFIASSLLKLLALPNVALCEFMKTEFNRYAKVFPIDIGHIDPDLYRTVVGAIELAMGTLLAFGRYPWTRLAAFTLMVIMIGAAYTHYAVGEADQILVPGVFAALLFFILTRD